MKIACTKKPISLPPPLSLSSEWDKEAWRVRRNEETLNFKKEISGRDWVLTRVFRLSILSLGKKCGEGLWMCLVWYENSNVICIELELFYLV